MSGLTLAVFLIAQGAPAAAPGAEVRALTVRFVDDKGAEVTDLTPADVALIENGVTRDVVSFKPDRRPLSVAVLVDTSSPMASSYRLNVVDAVTAFVARLPDGTRYALWTTGDRPTKVLDFTDDRQAAARALRMVAPQGGNYVLDAVAEAAHDLHGHGREGDRTAVVAITGSDSELSYRDKFRAVEDALPDAELFLSVRIDSGDADFETRSNLSYVLDKLAVDTGGLDEVILSPMAVDGALRRLSAALRSGYRLAYATVPDLKKRKLELRVARPHTKALLPAASAASS